jgi:hypothetical protein
MCAKISFYINPLNMYWMDIGDNVIYICINNHRLQSGSIKISQVWVLGIRFKGIALVNPVQ